MFCREDAKIRRVEILAILPALVAGIVVAAAIVAVSAVRADWLTAAVLALLSLSLAADLRVSPR